MRILLVSQKFNVGHLSTIVGWKRLADLDGHETVMYLDKRYKPFFEDVDALCVYDEKDLEQVGRIDVIIIMNLAPTDGVFLRRMKKNGTPKVIFVHHEPWRGWRTELNDTKRSKSLDQFVRRIVKKLVGACVLRYTDCVVCPSKVAAEFYRKNEMHLNDEYVILPLLYPDEMAGVERQEKRFFSFISTADTFKAFDQFVAFIKFAASRSDSIRFLIATKTDITSYIDEEIEALQVEGRLVIQQGRDLTVEEINAAYDASRCVWLVYRISTQSGVILKAFMAGTPCIASNVGVFGEQIDGSNGILLRDPNDFDEILDAYKMIDADLQRYSAAARASFERYYLADTHLPEYQAILRQITGEV